MNARIPLIGCLAVVVVCAGLSLAVQARETARQATAQGTVLHVCNCGADCQCKTVSTKPGKCECGQELAAMHVLKIERGEGILCTCGKDCQCKLNEKDSTRCGCGKPVKRVSLKGLYVCACGEGCTCNTVSDKPGKCHCGSDLRKVT